MQLTVGDLQFSPWTHQRAQTSHTHILRECQLCVSKQDLFEAPLKWCSVIEREFHSCKPVNTNWSEEEEWFNKFFCGSHYTSPSKIAAEFTWAAADVYVGLTTVMLAECSRRSFSHQVSNCSIFGPDLGCRTLLLQRLINVYHTWHFNQNRTYEVHLIVSGNLTRTNLVLLFQAYLFDCFSQIAAYKDNSTDWLLDVH